MNGKPLNIVITGASMGLGRAITETCVKKGASVLLCARGKEALLSTEVDLKKMAGPQQVIASIACDIRDEKQVDRLFEEAEKTFSTIHALVNNAGVYGPLGEIGDVDWQKWKEAVEINLFGPVYTSRVFSAHFKRRCYGKIVNLSGGGATNPLPGISSYAAAKAALVRFTETLAQELARYHVDVNAIAPGVLDTRLTDELIAAGPSAVGESLYKRITGMASDGPKAMLKATELIYYLCSEESDGVTGRLISSLWDPWPNLHERLADLEGSDIYTLRRIVPKDRGKDWDQ